MTLPGGEVAGYLDLSLHEEEGLGYAAAIFRLTLELVKRELATLPSPRGGPSAPPAGELLTRWQREVLELYGQDLKEARAILGVKNKIGNTKG